VSTYIFTESSFENAILELFEKAGYEYSCGFDIHRAEDEVLLIDDFKDYLFDRYEDLDLMDDEIELIIHNLLAISETSLYRTMKSTLATLRNGYVLDRSKYNKKNVLIEYFDFEDIETNIFKAVNQLSVKGSTTRRPDIVVHINGIPVSVFELKTISEEDVKLHDAYEQLNIRYARDIPNLMRFSFVSVISDGANTKCGSLFAKYKHFFPWKSTDGKNYSGDGIPSLISLINGLFDKQTLLNVINDYIYFPDTSKKELMIVPKYSQYYATELLAKNIVAHQKPESDGKGGTYFGATGCGKSYTMLFLARKLARAEAMRNPTIVLLTDRTDLDDQLSEIFEVSKEYLIDENTFQVPSRKVLNDKVKDVSSGGIFLLTVQKFDEDVGLLTDRTNVVCISDEAHRTQVNLDASLDITESGIRKHYGFAHYLRESFPNATYVGFTGTPIDATINVFGPIVCSYNMKQSVDDGSTVRIKLKKGPSQVRLDDTKLAIVDKYYSDRLAEGTNQYQVNQSIRDMATVRTIVDNDTRLDIVVKHFIDHYEQRVRENSTVCGKAMFVCYDRKIAYKVYRKIVGDGTKENPGLRPEWNIKKKTQLDESKLSAEELNKLKPVEMIKLVATQGDNDEPDLYNLCGTSEYRNELATLFKNEDSNFKIAIVVDMWLTGFDCECLDTMYLDKPVENHSLIQTVSRVNRVFEGKEEGLIVDYIGIENSLARAMQHYNGDLNPVENVDASYTIFRNQLTLIDELMHGFDYSRFEHGSDLDRLLTLNEGVEFVQRTNDRETRFMGLTLRMKKAFDLCVGDDRISESDMFKVHFYCAIRSTIFKMSGGEKPDSVRMNEEVKKLVDACITAMNDFADDIPEDDIDIFSKEYIEAIDKIQYKNTKFKMLIELLKKAIKQYSKTNKLKADEFSKRMKSLVDKYNNRDTTILISNDDVVNEFIDGITEEARKILDDLCNDANEFKKMGITFEEKAFYDILKAIRDRNGFEYSEERLISLAKQVKVIVDDKSKYTDWSSKKDIKASLNADIIRLLARNGYPPVTFEDVYAKVLAQVENFKTHNN